MKRDFEAHDIYQQLMLNESDLHIEGEALHMGNRATITTIKKMDSFSSNNNISKN